MRTLALCAVTGLVSSTIPASAADGPSWPQFQGPKRDNISTETALLKQWPDGGPKRIWTAEGLGIGFSTVSIADGTIYTAGSVDGADHVFAFDMDGNLKWKSPNGKSWLPGRARGFSATFGGTRATPTVDGEAIYHMSGLGRLAAFKASDGAEVWSVDVTEKFGGKSSNWGYAESVLVDGDRLFCYPGGAKGYMVALDKKTGETVWANTEIGSGAAYCSAQLVEHDGQRQVITMNAASVLGVDPATGRVLWRHAHETKNGINITMPVFHEGLVYATSGYGYGGRLLRLKRGSDHFVAEEVWYKREMDNHHGGVVLVDGKLYGTGHVKKGLFGLDMKTGDVVGKLPGKGAITYADGMLYYLDEKGTMQLVDISKGKPEVVSSFPVPKGGQGSYWAHPVVCGGRLYLRHADKLYVHDIRQKP